MIFNCLFALASVGLKARPAQTWALYVFTGSDEADIMSQASQKGLGGSAALISFY